MAAAKCWLVLGSVTGVAASPLPRASRRLIDFGGSAPARWLTLAEVDQLPSPHPPGMLRKKKVVPRFVGGKMTPELSAALPHLSSLSSAQSRGVLKLVIDHIKGADYKPADAEDMAGSLGVDVSGLRRPE